MNISEAEHNSEIKFNFIPINDPSHYSNIFSKENFKTLEKWGLIQNMELIKFRFNMNLDLKDLQRFLKDMFNDKNVKQNLQALNFGLQNDKNYIDSFQYKKLFTKSTNLDAFNVLYESGLCTGENGYIQKDYEDYFEGILISDKLKQALMIEESEYFCNFNEDLRNEFIFHIFKRLVIGGSLCQYEDHVIEYLNLTKDFYKDLVSAAKDSNTGEIVIRSIALEIIDIENANLHKIQGHPQNFFYVVIDPIQRHLHLWYHKWVPFW